MSRILTVATSEFLSLVRTKFFIIGILMAPVLIALSIALQVFANKRVDTADHAVAVIDHSGALYAALSAAADKHNKETMSGDKRTGPRFVVSSVDVTGKSMDDVRVDLSAKVRREELFAFVDIPADVLDITTAKVAAVNYYTETPSYDALPRWISGVLDRAIEAGRFSKASVDADLITKLTRPTPLTTLSLVQRKADGTTSTAKEVDQFETFVIPFGLMYLLFIAVMTAAPQLLNAVIEEKMSKISEVLVASVTPFQLMMGKLTGTAAVSFILAIVYLGGGIYTLFSFGREDVLQPALVGWFVIFLLCAVMIFGSIFTAIGAASSDIKDAQGMMQVAMILVMLPVFMAPVVLRAPDSPLAVGASFFPTATPFLMLLRLATTPGPPVWQVALSVVTTLATACLFVWAAAKIFRVGLLMQGKGATLPEMIRWIRA